MYHLVQGLGAEYITQNDSLASMAAQEGFSVLTNLDPDEINDHLEYNSNWEDMPIKN